MGSDKICAPATAVIFLKLVNGLLNSLSHKGHGAGCGIKQCDVIGGESITFFEFRLEEIVQ